MLGRILGDDALAEEEPEEVPKRGEPPGDRPGAEAGLVQMVNPGPQTIGIGECRRGVSGSVQEAVKAR